MFAIRALGAFATLRLPDTLGAGRQLTPLLALSVLTLTCGIALIVRGRGT